MYNSTIRFHNNTQILAHKLRSKPRLADACMHINYHLCVHNYAIHRYLYIARDPCNALGQLNSRIPLSVPVLKKTHIGAVSSPSSSSSGGTIRVLQRGHVTFQ